MSKKYIKELEAEIESLTIKMVSHRLGERNLLEENKRLREALKEAQHSPKPNQETNDKTK